MSVKQKRMSMTEYIERAEAIRAVVEAVDSGLATTAEDLEEILGDLTAAEVEPVRHAHWIVDDEYLVCSHCGESYRAAETRGEVEFQLKHGDVNKRCHGCGAHMEEVAE